MDKRKGGLEAAPGEQVTLSEAMNLEVCGFSGVKFRCSAHAHAGDRDGEPYQVDNGHPVITPFNVLFIEGALEYWVTCHVSHCLHPSASVRSPPPPPLCLGQEGPSRRHFIMTFIMRKMGWGLLLLSLLLF